MPCVLRIAGIVLAVVGFVLFFVWKKRVRRRPRRRRPPAARSGGDAPRTRSGPCAAGPGATPPGGSMEAPPTPPPPGGPHLVTDPRRDRRGRGHHPPRPEGDPRGGGLRGRGRDRPGRRGRRAGHASYEPDLAILDIKMPGLDGLVGGPGDQPASARAAVLILTAFSQRDLDRAGPRRRRAGLPRQAVPEERADPGHRGRHRPVPARCRRSHDAGPEPRGAARDPQGGRPGQGPADGRARPAASRRPSRFIQQHGHAASATTHEGASAERIIAGELAPPTP